MFAAASLTDAFAELGAVFEADHPGTTLRFSFAGSTTLREQVLAGAPADVLAVANPEAVAAVVAAGGIDGEPVVFARNRLALVTPRGNPGRVTGLADLARDELLIGLCARQVPCGALAATVLHAAGVTAEPDTEEPDVRSLLTKVAAGDLDAGLVYTTDVAAAGDSVETVDVPETAGARTDYLVAVLDDGDGDGTATARSFVALVVSPVGRRVLARHGFDLP